MEAIPTQAYTSLLKFLLNLSVHDPLALETSTTTLRAGNLQIRLSNDYFAIALRNSKLKNKGTAPSREPNDRYTGGSPDGLFSGGEGSFPVPKGLRDAAGGAGDDEKERNSGDGIGGNSGGGGDDGGEGGDDGGEGGEGGPGSNDDDERQEADDDNPPFAVGGRGGGDDDGNDSDDGDEEDIFAAYCQRLRTSQALTAEGIKSCAEYRRLEDVYEDVYEDERISTRRSTSKWVRRKCNRCRPRKQAFRNRKRARGIVIRKLQDAERRKAGREDRRHRESSHRRASSMPALKAIWRTSVPVAPKFNAEDWF